MNKINNKNKYHNNYNSILNKNNVNGLKKLRLWNNFHLLVQIIIIIIKNKII